MKPLGFMAVVCLALTLGMGCANLKTVRDFADESAKLSAYTELTTRFRDTYQREQPYVTGQAAQLAQANDRKRKAAYRDLLEVHRSVSAYLRTLATLAGDRTFEVAKPLDGLAAGIKAHPEFGLEANQVEACSNLSQVVAKWIGSAHQEKAVRAMLREGDPHLQTLLAGMAALVNHYRRTNENERRSVLGLLEVEIPYADAPKDLLLATLAKAQLQSKSQEYQFADARYAEAERGIRAIQEGHRMLVEQVDRPSNDEAEALISALTKDIQTIRNGLQALHSW